MDDLYFGLTDCAIDHRLASGTARLRLADCSQEGAGVPGVTRAPALAARAAGRSGAHSAVGAIGIVGGARSPVGATRGVSRGAGGRSSR
jgi:hypothetical protein